MRTISIVRAVTTVRSVRTAKVASLALASAILLGACGSGSDQAQEAELPSLNESAVSETTVVPEQSETKIDPEEAMAKFEACMADHGVDVASFGPGGGGAKLGEDASDDDSPTPDFDAADFEEANAACEPILTDAFGEFEMSPEDEAKFDDDMLAMQKCLSDKGFEIDLSGGSFELDDSIDFDEFQQAMNTCAPEGAFGPGQ